MHAKQRDKQMGAERITLQAGGQTWRGIKEIEIEAAFDHAAHMFHFTVAPVPSLLKRSCPAQRSASIQIAI
jgi:hypothetical protein